MATQTTFTLPHLTSSQIVIAVCQLEVHGKHKTLVGDRNSFGWEDIEAVKTRVTKAADIIDALNQSPQRTIDIVVFPEYSLPVRQALRELQSKAKQYGQVIIAGSDNLTQPDSNNIFNQCPIILPDGSVVWSTKRHLSSWEYGYIDEPEGAQIPRLSWTAKDGKTYWIEVPICLDFNFAKKTLLKGGGIFIVPMCSSDIESFRGWADDLLRLESGTATVLCNGYGKLGVGQSSLVVMEPNGKPFKPAFELPKNRETVAVFELDLRRLAPPKKTSLEPAYPLGKTFFYSLLSTSGKTELKTLDIIEKEVATRGVINPALFANLDKRTRMAFLSTENFWESVGKLRNQDFEVLAILGQHDILITHLHENRYDMIYDIKKVLNWRTSVDGIAKPDDDLMRQIHDTFPFFRVDVYFKVLGAEIPRPHSRLENRMPSFEERIKIIKLGSDWNDEQVSDEDRATFLERKWILKPTDKKPGHINSIMTVSLEHLSPEMGDKQALFEDHVIPQIIKRDIVTSAYRGRSQILAFSYVFRIWAGVDELYELIEDIHKLASEIRVAVNTSTYVVLKQLSTLSLEKAVLSPSLSAEDTAYKNMNITPKLRDESNDRLRSLSKDNQSEYIKYCRIVQEAMSDIEETDWLRKRYNEIEGKLLEGLLGPDFELLKEVHVFFHDKVEASLKHYIENEISDEEFATLKSALEIQSQRTKKQLFYQDRIKIVAESAKMQNRETTKTRATRNLHNTTVLRNAITHTNFETIALGEYTNVIAIYCEFLRRWKVQRNSPSNQ